MPQTTYLPLFRATYPILAPVQKPPGITISTTLPPNATPNAALAKPVQRDKKADHSKNSRNHK